MTPLAGGRWGGGSGFGMGVWGVRGRGLESRLQACPVKGELREM